MRRVADIYLDEGHRLFTQFAFRSLAEDRALNTVVTQWSRYLDETDTLAHRHCVADSWRASQRHPFSGS